MTTPNSPSPNEERFDDQLRRGLDFKPAAIEGGWEKLRGKLPPPPPPPPAAPPGRGGWRQFVGGLAVGALLWWGGGQVIAPAGEVAPTTAPTVVAGTPVVKSPASAESVTPSERSIPMESAPTQTAAAPAPAVATANVPHGAPAVRALPATRTHAAPPQVRLAAASAALPGGQIGALVADSSRPATHPSHLLTETRVAGLSGIEYRDSLIRHEITTYQAAPAPADTTGRANRLRRLLTEQSRALAVFQQQVDSAKRFLSAAPPELVTTSALDSLRYPTAPADWRKLPAPRSPWAVVALLETTPSWSVLASATPGVDEERTQASLAQSLQLQRTVGSRWRIRAGIGQASLQTQARYTSERTTQTTVIDSTSFIDTTIHQGTRIVMSVNTTRHDTSYFYFTSYDTLIRNKATIWLHTVTERQRLQQLLRPQYQFWTLPFSAQYLFVNRNRWSLGANASGQLTVFRGGSRPVWNGDQYVLQRVSASDGPYRPVSLSVSAGLEAQYRLTPRLSALLAPTMRWWAVPPGKNGAAVRTLLPAVQVGLTYGF